MPRRERRPPRRFCGLTSKAPARTVCRVTSEPRNVPFHSQSRPQQPAHAASRGRATSEVLKTGNAHPEWWRVLQVPGSAAPAGPVVGQADPCRRPSHNQSARGVQTAEMPRPQEQADEGCGTERVNSPAPQSRGVAGCPRSRGSRRQQSGSGSGEGLPQHHLANRTVKERMALMRRRLFHCSSGADPDR